MKKAVLINLGPLAGAPSAGRAPLLPWSNGWLRLGQSLRTVARSLRTFATMRDKSNSLSAVLLGTNTDRRYTVLLHVVFWAAAFFWIYFESTWLVGFERRAAICILTLNKLVVDFSVFYLISLAVRLARSIWLAVLLTVLLLSLAFTVYGLQTYYVYHYIEVNIPGVQPVFHKIAKTTYKEGPWTFIHSATLVNFLLIQISFGLGIPLIIKTLRAFFQSQVKNTALEKDNLKLELEFLRAQINPHFLFNTLNSVYSLIEDKDKTAAFIVVSLSDMMRYALYDAATTEVDVTKELAFIQNYIEIQQIRHRRRLEVALEIAPDLGPQRIPPLLLINFVENAVKHGVDKLRHDAWLRIRAYRDELGTFCFAVANARPAQAGDEVCEGIGTRNTRRRLDILYPGAYSLQIGHSATQFDILLRLWPPHNG